MLRGKNKQKLSAKKPQKPGIIENKIEYFNPEKLRLAKIDAGANATPEGVLCYYLRRAGYAKENGVAIPWTTWQERFGKVGLSIPVIKKPN